MDAIEACMLFFKMIFDANFQFYLCQPCNKSNGLHKSHKNFREIYFRSKVTVTAPLESPSLDVVELFKDILWCRFE